MAVNLKMLSKPAADRPLIMTIFGEPGVGKTTLAAMFPKPVFIRTEDGTMSLVGHDDAALFPIAGTSDDVLDAIRALQSEDHDRQTLVVDSITKLSAMIESEIVRSDPKARGLNQALGGYGNGRSAAAERHRTIREAAGRLSAAKRMNVVFIAHTSTETVNLPDAEPYSRYTINMSEHYRAPYIDDVDAVALVRLVAFVRGEAENKKAISTQEREIIAFPMAAGVTKNRLGITDAMKFDFGGGNPFDQWLMKRG